MSSANDSTLNCTILTDPGQLTASDLCDEYDKLSTAHRRLRTQHEHQLQQIYELRRQLQTTTNAETHLTAELEEISGVHAADVERLKQRHRAELDDIRAKLSDAQETALAAETEAERLRRQCDELQRSKSASPDGDESTKRGAPGLVQELTERLQRAEADNERLRDAHADERERLAAALKNAVHLERSIDDLRDQLECTAETLASKREELEQRLAEQEHAQERIEQLTEELGQLRTKPANDDDDERAAGDGSDPERRGNSLFAEVDDQRQHMKAVLAAQKKHYMQMRAQWAQAQQEIRSLKRENGAMKKELEICGAMFLNADQSYKERLNERIGKLLAEVERLEAKVAFTEGELRAVGTSRGVTWMDSMLTFCKNESAQCKNELRQCRLQKARVEEQCNTAELESARWRFEALRSRCIIIGREQLLEEAGIAFASADDAVYAQKARERERQQPTPRPQLMQATTVRPKVEVKQEPKAQTNLADVADQSTRIAATVVPGEVTTIPKLDPVSLQTDHSLAAESCQPVAAKLPSPPQPETPHNDENCRPANTPAMPASPARLYVGSPARLKLETIRVANLLAKSKSASTDHTVPSVANRQLAASAFSSIRPQSFDELNKTAGSTGAGASKTRVMFVQPAKTEPIGSGSSGSVGGTTVKIRHVVVKSKKPTLY